VADNQNCLGSVCVSNKQLQCVLLKTQRAKSAISFTGVGGGVVLYADLKSTNTIVLEVMLFSRCVRAEWRAVGTASAVDLLAPYASWWGSRLPGLLLVRS